jgi:hypothetical protein
MYFFNGNASVGQVVYWKKPFKSLFLFLSSLLIVVLMNAVHPIRFFSSIFLSLMVGSFLVNMVWIVLVGPSECPSAKLAHLLTSQNAKHWIDRHVAKTIRYLNTYMEDMVNILLLHSSMTVEIQVTFFKLSSKAFTGFMVVYLLSHVLSAMTMLYMAVLLVFTLPLTIHYTVEFWKGHLS